MHLSVLPAILPSSLLFIHSSFYPLLHPIFRPVVWPVGIGRQAIEEDQVMNVIQSIVCVLISVDWQERVNWRMRTDPCALIHAQYVPLRWASVSAKASGALSIDSSCDTKVIECPCYCCNVCQFVCPLRCLFVFLYVCLSGGLTVCVDYFFGLFVLWLRLL